MKSYTTRVAAEPSKGEVIVLGIAATMQVLLRRVDAVYVYARVLSSLRVRAERVSAIAL